MIEARQYETNRLQCGANLVDFARTYGLFDYIEPGDPSELVEHLTYESFMGLLVDMSAVATGRPTEDEIIITLQNYIDDPMRQSQDARDYLPAPEDKQALLCDILEVAKKAKSPQHAAMTLAAGVLSSHPFTDGNGRTARSLYHFLMRGENTSKAELEIINSTEGDEKYPIPLQLFKLLRQTLQASEDGSHIVEPHTLALNPKYVAAVTSESAMIEVQRRIGLPSSASEMSMAQTVLAEFAIDTTLSAQLLYATRDIKAVSKNTLSGFDDKKYVALDKMFLDATDADLSQIHEAYRKITYDGVLRLIKVLAGVERCDIALAIATKEYGAIQGYPDQIMASLLKGEITYDPDNKISN